MAFHFVLPHFQEKKEEKKTITAVSNDLGTMAPNRTRNLRWYKVVMAIKQLHGYMIKLKYKGLL